MNGTYKIDVHTPQGVGLIFAVFDSEEDMRRYSAELLSSDGILDGLQDTDTVILEES